MHKQNYKNLYFLIEKLVRTTKFLKKNRIASLGKIEDTYSSASKYIFEVLNELTKLKHKKKQTKTKKQTKNKKKKQQKYNKPG